MADPTPITIYTSHWCPYCRRATALLQRRGIGYREINVEDDPSARALMIARSGRRTVPQIFIGEHPIGGSDELVALEKSGELDRLLAAHAPHPLSDPVRTNHDRQ
ncbi:MAG: glutaredoxin 3 [Gammaproteobacteria bacterium]|nr:glutaredoxin 3 [Gammaproteobacteria bacterium]